MLQTYFEITEEGGGMLQVPLDVEGDHSGASGALSLHELVLGVRGQGCTGKEKPSSQQVGDGMVLLS